jgi:hypothetical protein
MSVVGVEGAPGSLRAIRTDLKSAVGDIDLNQLPERGLVPGGEVR